MEVAHDVGGRSKKKKGASSKYDSVKASLEALVLILPNLLRSPTRSAHLSFNRNFQVKVWLGAGMDHYYVLSRFLISRMLTVTRIPSVKAVKIALEVKKHLVEKEMLNIKQAELETILFGLMRDRGFGESYVSCYRLVTQFYQLRQPLVIFISGAPWTGKSTIAQQLASRLNMPNVMQTDITCEMLRAVSDGPLSTTPLLQRQSFHQGQQQQGQSQQQQQQSQSQQQQQQQQQQGQSGSQYTQLAPKHLEPHMSSQASQCDRSDNTLYAAVYPEAPSDRVMVASNGQLLVQEWQRECHVVWKALSGDLSKTLSDGKPLIIEGLHLDPSHYLSDLAELGIVILPDNATVAAPVSKDDVPCNVDAAAAAGASGEYVPADDLVTAAAAAVAGDSNVAASADETAPSIAYPERESAPSAAAATPTDMLPSVMFPPLPTPSLFSTAGAQLSIESAPHATQESSLPTTSILASFVLPIFKPRSETVLTPVTIMQAAQFAPLSSNVLHAQQIATATPDLQSESPQSGSSVAAKQESSQQTIPNASATRCVPTSQLTITPPQSEIEASIKIELSSAEAMQHARKSRVFGDSFKRSVSDLSASPTATTPLHLAGRLDSSPGISSSSSGRVGGLRFESNRSGAACMTRQLSSQDMSTIRSLLPPQLPEHGSASMHPRASLLRSAASYHHHISAITCALLPHKEETGYSSDQGTPTHLSHNKQAVEDCIPNTNLLKHILPSNSNSQERLHSISPSNQACLAACDTILSAPHPLTAADCALTATSALAVAAIQDPAAAVQERSAGGASPSAPPDTAEVSSQRSDASVADAVVVRQLRPLFIPIVLRMSELDQRLAAEDNEGLQRQHVHTPAGGSSSIGNTRASCMPSSRTASVDGLATATAVKLVKKGSQASIIAGVLESAGTADGGGISKVEDGSSSASLPMVAEFVQTVSSAGVESSGSPAVASAVGQTLSQGLNMSHCGVVGVASGTLREDRDTHGISLEERVERGRLLQEHLVSFEGVGLPVIHVEYGNFSAAVDQLHDHVLECIQLAMAWLVQDDGVGPGWGGRAESEGQSDRVGGQSKHVDE